MKFREFKTSSGNLALAGKNAESNEELIKQVGKDEFVFHTALPGSPFVNLKNETGKKIAEKDKRESAIFCASKSQDWRDNKKDVVVHVFLGKDIHKESRMKLGTFGVKKYKAMKIRKEEIKNFLEKNG